MINAKETEATEITHQLRGLEEEDGDDEYLFEDGDDDAPFEDDDNYGDDDNIGDDDMGAFDAFTDDFLTN